MFGSLTLVLADRLVERSSPGGSSAPPNLRICRQAIVLSIWKVVMLSMGKVHACIARLAARRTRDTHLRVEPTNPKLEKVKGVILNRQLGGEETTLRQIHKFSGLDQPQALNLVAQLEREGVVEIERNLNDAFESIVSLNEDSVRRMRRTKRKKIA